MGVDDMTNPTYNNSNKFLKGGALPLKQVLTKQKTIGVHPYLKFQNRNADAWNLLEPPVKMGITFRWIKHKRRNQKYKQELTKHKQ